MRTRHGLCSLTIGASSILTAPAVADLLGYWNFDATPADASGNGRDLTLFGSAGYASGLFDGALSLPGDPASFAQRLSDDDVYDFGGGDFTVQAWVNFSSLSGEQVLIEKFSGESGPGWTLTKLTNHSVLFFGAGGFGLSTLSDVVVVGDWQQVVARRSGDLATIWINGVQQAEVGGLGSISDTAGPLFVGRRNPDDPRGFALNGLLDEVAIWNTALTDTQIRTLWNDGIGSRVPGPSSAALLALGCAYVTRRRR